MQLSAVDLLTSRQESLLKKRAEIKKTPGISLLWVGDDAQTGKFVHAKQNMAKALDCQFFLHQFQQIGERQLMALIDGLNRKKDVDGIVLQLPLPDGLDTGVYLRRLNPEKDIDGLNPQTKFGAPTPLGILALLEANDINPNKMRTMIIGDGRLVGRPLSEMFRANKWEFTQIDDDASKRALEIAEHNLIISCTGVANLITPEMVTKETLLIDGTGIDVDVNLLEPLVKAITPKKGAIGPLTVSFLFENLLTAAS